jgi:hypothetical protein
MLGEIIRAIGEALAPIFREIIPVFWNILRQPEDAKPIRATPEQDQLTKEVNDAWDRVLDRSRAAGDPDRVCPPDRTG